MVEYVLAAEFDIDKGSQLSFQYPTATGCDTGLLAEWMLPEGAHLHKEDFTWFILNNVSSITKHQVEPNVVERLAIVFIKSLDSDEWTVVDEGKEVRVRLRDQNLNVTDSEGIVITCNISGASIQYSRNQMIHFPETNPLIAIRFRSTDDRTYFTEVRFLCLL